MKNCQKSNDQTIILRLYLCCLIIGIIPVAPMLCTNLTPIYYISYGACVVIYSLCIRYFSSLLQLNTSYGFILDLSTILILLVGGCTIVYMIFYFPGSLLESFNTFFLIIIWTAIWFSMFCISSTLPRYLTEHSLSINFKDSFLAVSSASSIIALFPLPSLLLTYLFNLSENIISLINLVVIIVIIFLCKGYFWAMKKFLPDDLKSKFEDSGDSPLASSIAAFVIWECILFFSREGLFSSVTLSYLTFISGRFIFFDTTLDSLKNDFGKILSHTVSIVAAIISILSILWIYYKNGIISKDFPCWQNFLVLCAPPLIIPFILLIVSACHSNYYSYKKNKQGIKEQQKEQA